MPFAGIDALIAVTQIKVDNANNNAMDGATKQRALVRKEEILHAQQSKLDEVMTNGKDKGVSQSDVDMINGFLSDQHTGTSLSINESDVNGGSNKLDDAGSDAQKQNSKNMNAAKDALGNVDKDLQNQDKLGNFEIQGLMSEFNEAQTLASSVLKKKDDAGNAVIQKI